MRLRPQAVVAALEAVSVVTWFDEDTPAALIETLRPEVAVKGGDWPAEKIVAPVATLARGGRWSRFPSSTSAQPALLEKIRKETLSSKQIAPGVGHAR